MRQVTNAGGATSHPGCTAHVGSTRALDMAITSEYFGHGPAGDGRVARAIVKAARWASLSIRKTGVAQTALSAAYFLLRDARTPRPQKPEINMTQVAGSGTAATAGCAC